MNSSSYGVIFLKAVLFFAFCKIDFAIAQGYGNLNEVLPQQQAQPSRRGMQQQSYDSANAPSYDNAQPSNNGQYQEERCAAEYPNPNFNQGSPNPNNPQKQQPAQSRRANFDPNPQNRNLNDRPNPQNAFQGQEPRRSPSTSQGNPNQPNEFRGPEPRRPPSTTQPTAPETEETSTEPSEQTKPEDDDPNLMQVPEADPRIDPRVQPNPAPRSPKPSGPRPQASTLDNEPAPSANNQRRSESPSAMSTDALIRLISELNNKLQNLEESQRTLNKNVDDLQARLKAIPVKKKETTQDLVSGQPAQALQKWKELEQNVDSVEQLQNETAEVVQDALEQKAPPPAVMDFVHELPNKPVQTTAYNAVADKMLESDEIQESMNWKEMTSYCRNTAQDTGRNSPTTMKMLSLQDQMRLKANQPIAQGSMLIQEQRYIPAASVWLNLVQDIPENPIQLETNMKAMMIRTYAKNPFNLPMAFRFILILPESQGNFKRVAYNCLLEEMQANGHVYDPSNSRRGQAYQVPQPGNDQQRPAQQLQQGSEQPQKQQQRRNPQQQHQQPQQQEPNEGFRYY